MASAKCGARSKVKRLGPAADVEQPSAPVEVEGGDERVGDAGAIGKPARRVVAGGSALQRRVPGPPRSRSRAGLLVWHQPMMPSPRLSHRPPLKRPRTTRQNDGRTRRTGMQIGTSGVVQVTQNTHAERHRERDPDRRAGVPRSS